MSLWGYVGLTQFIEGLFPEPVDVADRSRLKPFVRPQPSAKRSMRSSRDRSALFDIRDNEFDLKLF